MKNKYIQTFFVVICLSPISVSGQLTLIKTDASGCTKHDGSITASFSGGGSIEYALNGGDYQSSGSFTGLGEGTYTVTARRPGAMNSCIASESIEIKDGSNIRASVSGGGAFSFCEQDGPPKVTLACSASGGSGLLTYSWPNGILENAGSGTHTCTVIDAAGCRDDASATIVTVPIRCSRDPNDITGPSGYASPRWVSVSDRMPYLIRFENDPKFATAPALKVVVELPIDSDLNLFSVRLGDFGFANMVFSVPANTTSYSKRLDLRDSLDIYVDVTAGIDVASKKVFWIFESIDPATGLEPTSTTIGMLPVNDTITRRGEGFVNFSVKSKSSTLTRDTILAKAAIVFDVNETIFTNEYSNVVDASPPSSQLIQNLPANLDSTNIHLSWTAQDDPGGCGIRDYTLFVSINGGPFLVHQSNILDTFIVFRGVPGATYAFFTSAVDNVGNVEPSKAQGEITVSVLGDPTINITGFDKNVYCSGDSISINWNARQIQNLDILMSTTGQVGSYQFVAQNVLALDSMFKWQIPSNFSGCNPCFVIVRDTAMSTSVADTIRTVINALPPVVAGGVSSVCVGGFSQLQASGATSYRWLPSTFLSSSTSNAPYVNPSNPTNIQYVLIGTDLNGCVNKDTFNLSVSDIDSTIFYSLTCNPTSVGTTIDTLTNVAGCDSLIFLITLTDTIPPTATCHNALTLPLNSFGQATLGVAQINNGSSDNCGVSLILSKTNFNCIDLGTNTVTLTVSDPFNNTATCQSIITVVDLNFPSICNPSDTIFSYSYTGPGTISAGGANCMGVLDWDAGTPTVSSNIGANIVSFNFDAALTGYNIGDEVPANSVVLVAYIVLDDQTNRDTFYFPITFEDITPPLALCRNITAKLSTTGTAHVTSMQVNNGSTDACGIDTIFLSSELFTCINTGDNITTLTVIDLNQNSSTCTSIVTIIDEQAPSITCPTSILASTTQEHCTAEVNYALPIGTDNCSGATTVQSDNTGLSSGSFFPKGVTTLTYAVTDAVGLSSSCQFNITILDNQVPSIVCPANLTFNTGSGVCTAIVSYANPVVTDNCSSVTLNRYSGPATGTSVDVGNSTVTYIATDGSGNTSSCSFNLTVIDKGAPSAVCANSILPLDAAGNAIITAGQVAGGSNDNCTSFGDLVILPTSQSYNCNNLGTNYLTVTVTDAAGNTSSCIATITVTDTTAPTVVCTPGQTLIANSGCLGYYEVTAPALSDNCSGVTWTVSPNGPDFPIGVTNLIYTALDGSGNTATCTQTVTVKESSLLNAVITIEETSGTINNDGIICRGADVLLTAVGGTSYQWGNSSTSNSILVNPHNNTSYTVTVTGATGCSATLTKSVDVNSLPSSSILVQESSGNVPDDGVVCIGENVILNASGGVSYLWNTGSVTSSISLSTSNTTVYTVTVTDMSGCSAISSTTVTASPLPIPTVVVTETSGIYNDGLICLGSSITLTAGGGATYIWASGATSSSVLITPTASTLYSVTVTNINGCSSNTSTMVTVNPVPTASITVNENPGDGINDGAICQGTSVMLSANGGTSYSWSNGSSITTITVSPVITTTYTVTVTNPNCASVTSSFTVSVSPTPVINSLSTLQVNTGTVVSVNGNNFNGISEVRLNGTLCPVFTVTSNNLLYVTSPINGNIQNLTLSNNCSTGTYQTGLSIISFSPASAQPGSLITIQGNNFNNLQSVTIGGAPQILLSNNSTSAVFFLMPGTPGGPITVTSTGGQATSSENLTISTTPVPYIQQGAKLVGTSFAGFPQQGSSVAVSADGNTAIIGAPTDNSNVGAAWIFVRNGNSWAQQGTKLIGTGAIGKARQGTSVAISADGNTALIGGNTDNSNAGAVWVFKRTGTNWSQQGAKLVGTGAIGGAQQGISVSLSADGNTAVSGGIADNNYVGATWIFKRNSGVWTQLGNKLNGTSVSGAARQGSSVAISSDGKTLVVGACNDSNRKGAVWIYVYNGSAWIQQGGKLVGNNSSADSYQGWSVALSANGNIALVGGCNDNLLTGAAWIFSRTNGAWAQEGSKLVGTQPSGPSRQGSSVGISADGNTAVVGGFADNSNNGSMWVFKRSSSVWVQQGAKVTGSGASGAAKQCTSIGLSSNGTTAALGGPSDASSKGAIWVYVPNLPGLILSSLVSTNELAPSTNDEFVLRQNIPNPFTDHTVISFSLPEACTAEWQIADISGQIVLVMKKDYPAGENTENFDLDGYSGIYTYTLKTNFGIKTRVMAIVR
jgi:hypothetical protein